ncbi:uncharacterized protein LOC127106423 [Lathyrus oleraceus]|uniref:uncharacterized protein LOC127106423 n=1 Tax=Pisum sativum TaxID=3888 RepID=UPI0021D19A9B|nr:uncharacterized protein LOC127106423 [Pisum sativum]
MYPSPEVEQHSEKNDDSSSSEKDMAAEDVPDISPVKKTTVRKSPGKVVVVHLDNISFHLEDEAAKWKFVIQRRVAVERELGKDAAEIKEVMDLIKVAGLLKTVAGFSQCYEGLVKEFIVNIPEDIADKKIKEFCKVFVRGRRVKGAGELEATDNKVCREITSRQVKGWPIKKHLPVGKLTVKYAILHKIGAANWVPTNHISTIANTLGRFIFVVGTKLNFDYSRFMFEQIIKHASTNAVKLPIAFAYMICGIILNQHPGDCKELGEGIRVETARKQSLEALIASLEQAEGENIDHAKEVEAHTSSERFATNDETSGNSVSSVDEAASSSSSD